MIKTISLKRLAVNLLLPVGVGIAASLLTRNAPQIYANIVRPPLSPRAWTFPVVWTVLYILLGIAAYIAGEAGCKNKKAVTTVYLVGLLLNFLWPVLFFSLGWFEVALAELLLLWLTVFANAVYFYICSPAAGYLLIPYILWLSFAAYLNIGAVFLN